MALQGRRPPGRRGPIAAWEVAAMSVVTEHLEQRGSTFEVIPHWQAYTSIDEARVLGINADEV
jgi:hypothetical protein